MARQKMGLKIKEGGTENYERLKKPKANPIAQEPL